MQKTLHKLGYTNGAPYQAQKALGLNNLNSFTNMVAKINILNSCANVVAKINICVFKI